ncbi:autotransporter family protein, partial [Devosia indica]
ITVGGDYAGAGLLLIDADLTAGTADALIIAGNADGTTVIAVNDVSTSDASGTDILVVEVGGTSADDAFALAGGAFTSGAFTYDLGQIGSSWYLTSIFSAASPLYEAYPQALASLNTMPTLYQRVGNRHWFGAGGLEQGSSSGTMAYGLIEGSGIWTRIEGAHAHIEPKTSTTGSTYDINRWRLQAGLDAELMETARGKVIAGLTAHYGEAFADVTSAFGNGDIDTSGYGVGATLTWYGANGFYADAQAQLTWYDSDLASDTFGRLASGNDGFGYALSIEAGKRIATSSSWTVTPQAQLTWSSVTFDAFTGPNGEHVALTDGDSLQTRLGIAAEREHSWLDEAGKTRRANLYAIANLHYEVLNGTKVDVSGTPLTARAEPLSGEIGFGGSYNWNDDKYSVYGEASAATNLSGSIAKSYQIKATAGFRIRW